ncbi:MAG: FAD-dependent oxidoreductase [Rariglobus sp.]
MPRSIPKSTATRQTPYPISHRSIRPRESRCSNLLVPWCVSSTHIAFGAIRMEPVGMVLGQSAAMAAALALRDNCPVQRISVEELQDRLREVG